MKKILKIIGILIISNIKKIIVIAGILMISSFSYYGAVDENGEKVISFETNETQSAMELKNEVVEEQQEVEQVQEKTEIQVTAKVEEQKKTITEKIEKKEEEKTTEKNKEESSIVKQVSQTTKMEEQKNKDDEKQIEKSKEEATQIEINQDTSTQEKEQETVIPKCTETNHLMETGNTGKWFDTKQQAVAFYEKEIKEWEDKWLKDEIDDDTYYKNCPDGYEYWSCPLCQKWTLNLYY